MKIDENGWVQNNFNVYFNIESPKQFIQWATNIKIPWLNETKQTSCVCSSLVHVWVFLRDNRPPQSRTCRHRWENEPEIRWSRRSPRTRSCCSERARHCCCCCCCCRRLLPRLPEGRSLSDLRTEFRFCVSAPFVTRLARGPDFYQLNVSRLNFSKTHIGQKTQWCHAPLTFPLIDEPQASLSHVGAQVLHHAVDAVVQDQRARLRRDGLPAHGTLVLAFAPLSDAVLTEAVGAVQRHGLRGSKFKRIVSCVVHRSLTAHWAQNWIWIAKTTFVDLVYFCGLILDKSILNWHLKVP